MALTHRQIESWTLTILQRIAGHGALEDSAVELKSQWPDPTKSARRIAGHANAARGQPILWLIGVDEEKGIVGAANNEQADWWNQVTSQFDSVSPALTSITASWGGQQIIALQFDTTRSPYVVRNPAFGMTGAGPIEREVPWREGTSVRSATHNDLLLLMTPLRHVPFAKAVGASLIQQAKGDGDQYLWTLFVRVFLSMELGQRVVILDSDCDAVVNLGNGNHSLILTNLTTDSCSGGLLHITYGLSGEIPGLFRIKGQLVTAAWSMSVPTQINVLVRLTLINGERPIVLPIALERSNNDRNVISHWNQTGYDPP